MDKLNQKTRSAHKQNKNEHCWTYQSHKQYTCKRRCIRMKDHKKKTKFYHFLQNILKLDPQHRISVHGV